MDDGGTKGSGEGRPQNRGNGGTGKPARLPVRIRAAIPEDSERLAELRRQAEAVHARLLPDYFRLSAQDEGGRAAPPSEGGLVVTLVAERSSSRGGPPDPPLGYVSLKVVDTPRDPAMTPRRRTHVEAVVVDATARGQGIGTALMRAAADWSRRRAAAELVLTVWSDNAAADALYRRLGYQPIARILRLPLE